MPRGRTLSATRTWLLGAGVAVALGFAGCGGDTLSSQDLRTKATTVCSAAMKQINLIAMPNSSTGGIAFLRRGAAILRPELTALAMLHPPHAAATTYANSLGGLTQTVSVLDATAAGLTRGDDPAVAFKSLQQQLAPIELQANQGWQALEIPACAIR
jgi:hypothetical protein